MSPKLLVGLTIVAVFTFSCKKDEPVDEDKAVDNIHFTGDFDGEEKSFKNGVDNYGNGAGTAGGGAAGDWEEFQFTGFAQAGGGGPFINIGLIKHFNYIPEGPDFLEMWQEGTYAFGKRSDFNGGTFIEGACIEYYDPATEKYWSTDQAWGTQTGALAVTSIEESSEAAAQLIAEMNCSFTLYSADSLMIKVTDATIRGKVATN